MANIPNYNNDNTNYNMGNVPNENPQSTEPYIIIERHYVPVNVYNHMYQPSQINQTMTQSNTLYNTYRNSNDRYRNSNNTYRNPNNTYRNPNNTYRNPNNTYGNPNNTYRNFNNTYGNAYNTYGPPYNTYGTPYNTYGNPYNTYGSPHVYTNEHTTNVPAQNTNVVDTTNAGGTDTNTNTNTNTDTNTPNPTNLINTDLIDRFINTIFPPVSSNLSRSSRINNASTMPSESNATPVQPPTRNQSGNTETVTNTRTSNRVSRTARTPGIPGTIRNPMTSSNNRRTAAHNSTNDFQNILTNMMTGISNGTVRSSGYSVTFGSPEEMEDVPVGLSPQQINQFTELVNFDGEEQTICSVCRDEISTGAHCRKINSCSHYFHHNCLDTWLTNNHTCPNCRTDLRESNNSSEEPNNNGEPPSSGVGNNNNVELSQISSI
jgi:hypothetical protein